MISSLVSDYLLLVPLAWLLALPLGLGCTAWRISLHTGDAET